MYTLRQFNRFNVNDRIKKLVEKNSKSEVVHRQIFYATDFGIKANSMFYYSKSVIFSFSP